MTTICPMPITSAASSGILTVAEAAEAAQVSVSTIYRQIEAGNLRAKKIGRCVRILEEDLWSFLRSDGEAA